MVNRISRASILAVLLVVSGSGWACTGAPAAPVVTSPRAQFGADIGDDYFLATYTQIEAYWKKLDRESDRLRLVDIGRSEEGRTQWMAIITAPENFAKLDRYRAIAQRLAHADGLTDDQARALASEGRAVVWIDGGLHADEVLGSQQLVEAAYDLVSRSDPETLRVLRDDIILLVHANPDGEELAATWYMREADPARRSLNGLPRLYQKYAGHDDNRDFYMSTQSETLNMNRVLYQEWFPQIVYDHHQTAPAGTVMFAPPFRDPFNYAFDPLIPAGIDLLGAAMHSRFAAESKPGVTMRSGSTYSTWWNGGLRTTAYFHNALGLLTETLGGPTPVEIPFVAEQQLPRADLPFPIAPQAWHFRQAIAYEMTANRAVLDAASRYRETFLFNIYRMGKNAIDRGRRDSWTVSPHRMAADGASRGPARIDPARLLDPRLRDPRGYIVPSNQPDVPTATKFVNALLRNGIAVLRATASFRVDGTTYPPGSFVVKTDQAFRPDVLDMFEPQDHPDDVPYPGAAPTPPYDSAGWTLAFQMGVRFDRILGAFDGPFEPLSGPARPPAGEAGEVPGATGYLVGHQQNDAAIVVNRLLKTGQQVYWLRDAGDVAGQAATGAIYVVASPVALAILRQAASSLGVGFVSTATPPRGRAWRLHPVRVGLWDTFGGSVESGWMRWVLERYEFPFDLVYAPELDAGGLRGKYDVLIFPAGAIPARDVREPEPPIDLPAEYRARVGVVTLSRTVPQVTSFVRQGGTVLAIGTSATHLSREMGLPVRSALVETDADGVVQPLTREQFFVPGSILRARVATATPMAYGFDHQVDMFFDDSPAFAITPEGAAAGVTTVAWYDTDTPLRSGWAWGQSHLNGSAAVVDVPFGKGRVLLSGCDITFRAQSHGTFKFLFNGIFYGGVEPVSSQSFALSRRP